MDEQPTTYPGPLGLSRPPSAHDRDSQDPHEGVVMTGSDGAEGVKAFYIHVEARLGREAEVQQVLADILAAVEQEPETGPWYAVRYSRTSFGIFEAFPSIAGRRAHVDGRGGDIFRDLARMNDLLVEPAHVAKLDVLMTKRVFTH